MNKSLVVTSQFPLPEFSEPSSLDEARQSIITLGITMHEHAYLEYHPGKSAIIADFKALPFPNNRYRTIIIDPP